MKGSVAQVSQIALFVCTCTPPKFTVCWRLSGAFPENADHKRPVVSVGFQQRHAGIVRGRYRFRLHQAGPGQFLADGADVSHAKPARTVIARSETRDATLFFMTILPDRVVATALRTVFTRVEGG